MGNCTSQKYTKEKQSLSERPSENVNANTLQSKYGVFPKTPKREQSLYVNDDINNDASNSFYDVLYPSSNIKTPLTLNKVLPPFDETEEDNYKEEYEQQKKLIYGSSRSDIDSIASVTLTIGKVSSDEPEESENFNNIYDNYPILEDTNFVKTSSYTSDFIKLYTSFDKENKKKYDTLMMKSDISNEEITSIPGLNTMDIYLFNVLGYYKITELISQLTMLKNCKNTFYKYLIEIINLDKEKADTVTYIIYKLKQLH